MADERDIFNKLDKEKRKANVQKIQQETNNLIVSINSNIVLLNSNKEVESNEENISKDNGNDS